MTLRALLLLGTLFSGLAGAIGPVRADQPVPVLAARVTDKTGTLSAEQALALEQKLAAIEAKRGSQVAVLLVPATEPETIEQYAIRVADAWKLGRKGVDDGVLLLVAKNDRGLRIEVGRGLEGAIPDAIAKRIIADVITPRFRDGDFAGGLNAGVDALGRVIDGEPLPPPARAGAPGGRDLQSVAMGLLAFIVIGGAILRAVLGRVLGAVVVGGIAGVAGWLLLGSILFGILACVIAFFVALANGNAMRSSGRGWGGGSSWGGGGSSGGFSGGGGSFGGGGASGKW